MTRKELLSELSRCAALYGYPFTTGLTYRINSELVNPPQVWVEPPQLVSKKGRSEGVKEYRIVMRIIDAPALPDKREKSLDTMEKSSEGIISALAGHDDIIKTSYLEYTTEENTLTNRGDISVKSVFTIQTKF